MTNINMKVFHWWYSTWFIQWDKCPFN